MMKDKNLNRFHKRLTKKRGKESDLLDLPMNQFLNKIEASLPHSSEYLEAYSDLDAYPLFTGQALYVLSLPNRAKISYQRGIQELLGYEEHEFDAHFSANCFHPDQCEILHKIIKGAINYGIGQSHDKGKDAWLLLMYKVRKKDGSYIPVIRQTSVYHRDKRGRMLSSISIITDLSGMNNSDKVEWRFKGPRVNEDEFRAYIYGAMSSLFSKREMDILHRIVNGETSKEIGSALFISKNTVDTHRRNMLKKADCANTYELIQFSKNNGIL